MEKPKVEFLTGKAGTGKTYELKRRIADTKSRGKRNYGILAATTGIAAVNLSGGEGDQVTTINSLLKYYDTNSLMDRMASGKLHKSLAKCIIKGRNICIDEISMMDAVQLDLIYNALVEVNKLEKVQSRGGLGLVLSGDFCQLPPINAKWAFEAQCWGEFAERTTKLEKVWRQGDKDFLDTINAAREGDGVKCAAGLSELDKKYDIFQPLVDSHFEGTTIFSKNSDVDKYNDARLIELLHKGHRKVTFKNYRWGKQLGEWNKIPDELVLCEGAYVMILTNNPPEFDFVNGDCGEVLYAGEQAGVCSVKLVRGDKKTVTIKRIGRRVWAKEHPQGLPIPEFEGKKEWIAKAREKVSTGVELVNWSDAYESYLIELTNKDRSSRGAATAYFDFLEGKWVIGEIRYMPLRLAYASTCHKTQGLSLDRVQIDFTNRFFGSPGMLYVALSRCKSPEGLRLIGGPKLIEERCNVFGEVLQWI